MNISEGFIKRPIATSLLMAAIALFGTVAYRSLPVSDLPNVSTRRDWFDNLPPRLRHREPPIYSHVTHGRLTVDGLSPYGPGERQ